MKKKKKSGFWAGTLSLIFPGAGQYYNGSWIKGTIIIGVVLLSIYMMSLPLFPIINSFGSLDGLVDHVFSSLVNEGVLQINIEVNVQRIMCNFAIWTVVFFAAYVYSVIDAIAVAGKKNRENIEEKFEKEIMDEFLTAKRPQKNDPDI